MYQRLFESPQVQDPAHSCAEKTKKLKKDFEIIKKMARILVAMRDIEGNLDLVDPNYVRKKYSIDDLYSEIKNESKNEAKYKYNGGIETKKR